MFKETFYDRHKDLELSNREVLSIDRQAVIQAVLAVCNINKKQRSQFDVVLPMSQKTWQCTY